MELNGVQPGDFSLETGEAARCAFHPERATRTTCDRCGTFVCAECYELAPDGRALCGPCQGVVGTLSVPWERTDLPWSKRFLRTIVETILSPGSTLGRLDPRRLAPALLFSGLAGLFGVLVFVLLWTTVAVILYSLHPAELQVLADKAGLFALGALFYVLLLPVVVIVASLMHGSIFHVGAKSFGGRGTLVTSLRASAYMSSMYPAMALLALASMAPIVGFVFQLGVAGLFLFWPPLALFEVAKGVHGLHGVRAAASAAVPTVLEIGVVALAWFA